MKPDFIILILILFLLIMHFINCYRIHYAKSKIQVIKLGFMAILSSILSLSSIVAIGIILEKLH